MILKIIDKPLSLLLLIGLFIISDVYKAAILE